VVYIERSTKFVDTEDSDGLIRSMTWLPRVLEYSSTTQVFLFPVTISTSGHHPQSLSVL